METKNKKSNVRIQYGGEIYTANGLFQIYTEQHKEEYLRYEYFEQWVMELLSKNKAIILQEEPLTEERWIADKEKQAKSMAIVQIGNQLYNGLCDWQKNEGIRVSDRFEEAVRFETEKIMSQYRDGTYWKNNSSTLIEQDKMAALDRFLEPALRMIESHNKKYLDSYFKKCDIRLYTAEIQKAAERDIQSHLERWLKNDELKFENTNSLDGDYISLEAENIDLFLSVLDKMDIHSKTPGLFLKPDYFRFQDCIAEHLIEATVGILEFDSLCYVEERFRDEINQMDRSIRENIERGEAYVMGCLLKNPRYSTLAEEYI